MLKSAHQLVFITNTCKWNSSNSKRSKSDDVKAMWNWALLCSCSGAVCIQAQRTCLLRGMFSWPVFYVFSTSRAKMNQCPGWDGLSGGTQPGRAVEGWKGAHRHWLHCQPHIKGSAFLHLIRCCSSAAELQILHVTAIKAALGFFQGFRCACFQYL